jgi:predicted secreted protein
MAKMALLASYVSINGVDLSDHASKIELTTEVEEKDVTTFASLGWKEVLGGIKSGSLALTLKQDIAAASVDSQVWALFGSVTTFEVRLTNSARGTSNPGYTGSVLIRQWTPISGSPGDVADASVTWPSSGVISRQTS